MSTTTITATDGAALANLSSPTAADIYSIPPGSTITIETQRGFGSVSETAASQGLAGAVSAVSSILGTDGLT